jgi:hypothetical protein
MVQQLNRSSNVSRNAHHNKACQYEVQNNAFEYRNKSREYTAGSGCTYLPRWYIEGKESPNYMTYSAPPRAKNGGILAYQTGRHHRATQIWTQPRKQVLPPFQNIRCFSFVKQMYLHIF